MTIAAGMWLGDNNYSVGANAPARKLWYENVARLGRVIGIFRDRGSFEGFSDGTKSTGILKRSPVSTGDLDDVKAILASGCIYSANFNWRFGTSNKTPIWAQCIADGNFDYGVGRPGGTPASSFIYNPETNASIPMADCYSLYQNGLDLLEVQAAHPNGIILIEHLSESNIGHGTKLNPTGAQPFVPDIPSNTAGTDTPANRAHYSDAVLHTIRFWEDMGVHNVLHCISLAGPSLYQGNNADPWWANILAVEAAEGRTYVHLVGQDTYSKPINGQAKDWDDIVGATLSWSAAHSTGTRQKYAFLGEIGVQPDNGTLNTGTGQNAGTSVIYNKKADWMKQGKEYGVLHKDRLFGFIYNMDNEFGQETDTRLHYWEPETQTIAQEPDQGGMFTQSWIEFKAWFLHPDFALGPPIVTPSDLEPPPPVGETTRQNDMETGLADNTPLGTGNSAYVNNAAADRIIGDVRVDTALKSGGQRSAVFTHVGSSASSRPRAVWSWDVDADDISFKAKIYIPKVLAGWRLIEFRRTDGRLLATVVRGSKRTLQLRDANNNIVAQTVQQVPEGIWFRIEGRLFVHPTTRASNVFTLSYFSQAGATVPSEVISAPGGNYGLPGRKIQRIDYGICSPTKRAVTMNMDGLVADWVGGEVPPPVGTPAITSVVPSSGREGDSVVITGTDLDKVTVVKFDAVGSSKALSGTTQITTVVPAGLAPGSVTLRCHYTTPSVGAASSSFSILPPVVASGWEMADLDGGGGINAISASDSGNTLIAWGDISGPKRSLDQGVTWENCARGLADGGQGARGGGVIFKPASDLIAIGLCGEGVYYTSDAGSNWAEIDSTIAFGEGGGLRPRHNVGHLGCANATHAYFMSLDDKVNRFKWSDQTLIKDIVSGLAGLGEAVVEDSADLGTLFIGMRTSGVYRCTGADTATNAAKVAAQKCNGTNPPTDTMSLALAKIGTSAYIFAADNVDIKMAGPILSATMAWTVISPAAVTGKEACAIAARTVGTKINLAVGVSAATGGSGNYQNYFACMDAVSAARAWKPVTQYTNQKGITGDPWWAYLPKSQGGASPGFSNAPIISAHQAEDITWIDDNFFMGGGQQGCFLVDVNWPTGGPMLYPSMQDLGVTANAHCVADPNAAGLFYHLNTDHIVIATADGGETYRNCENGFPGGTMAGFDLAVEDGVTISRLYVCFGERASNVGGDVFYHANPLAFTNWTSLAPALGGKVPQGIEVFRAVSLDEANTPPRVFMYLGVVGQGLVRQILTIADPPVKVGGLTTVSATACFGAAQQERFEIKRLSDDRMIIFDPLTGIWLVRNARNTTPLVHKIWNVLNDATVGENWLAPISSDVCFVSIGDGPNTGVFKLAGLNAASGTATVENAGITMTAINKPSGSWRRPGPLRFNAQAQRMVVMDLQLASYPPGDCEAFQSDVSPYTTLTETTAPADAGLFNKVDGLDVDSNGLVIVSMQGPGAARFAPA